MKTRLTLTASVVVTSVCLMMSAVLANATTPRPTGSNCNLMTPPATAGEEMNHGITLRVFPRAKDIDAAYTGCQAVLAPVEGKWEVVSLTVIEKGDPVRIWSAHDTEGSSLSCRFRKGEIVKGNPDACPAPQFLLMKSLAPGCVQTFREAIAKQGLGAPRPAECEYN